MFPRILTVKLRSYMALRWIFTLGGGVSLHRNVLHSTTQKSPPQVCRKGGKIARKQKKYDTVSLPIAAFREKIVSTVRAQKVTFIVGETGCGKTTQIPQMILDGFPGNVKIAVTQPRRVAAVSLARRVAAERMDTIGAGVGYAVSGDVCMGSSITFLTAGFLLATLKADPRSLSRYTHIILDEVHERSVDADMLALVLKLFLDETSTKLVVMSATLQVQKFSDFFCALETMREPHIFVGAKRHELEEVYLDEIEDNFGQELFQNCRKQISSASMFFNRERWDEESGKKLGDHMYSLHEIILPLVEHCGRGGSTVLVFLPGIADISTLYFRSMRLEERPRGKVRFKIFALHSLLHRAEEDEVFAMPASNVCHVVYCSNVAESSITLPNVALVIDTGLTKRVVYNEDWKMMQYVTRWCSQASVTQRGGRAGRTMPGVSVRLFPRGIMDELEEYDPPEIESCCLAEVYLVAKRIASALNDKKGNMCWSPTTVLQHLVEPPDLKEIANARELLAEYGAIEAAEDDARLLPFGDLALALPFDFGVCYLVWLGFLWGCVADAVVMACALNTQDPFSLPTPLVTKNSGKHANNLLLSTMARNAFDGGYCSEPLMLRRLFIEFWCSHWEWCRKTGQTTAKSAHLREKQQTLEKLSRRFEKAISVQRTTMFVGLVERTALQLLELCPKNSREAQQLSCLARGDAVQNMDRVFEPDVSVLQSLLAAAFSYRILVPRKSCEYPHVAQDLSHTLMITNTERSPLPYTLYTTFFTAVAAKICPEDLVHHVSVAGGEATITMREKKLPAFPVRHTPAAPVPLIRDAGIGVQLTRQAWCGSHEMSPPLDADFDTYDIDCSKVKLKEPDHPCKLLWATFCADQGELVPTKLEYRNPVAGYHMDWDKDNRLFGVCAYSCTSASGNVVFATGATILPVSALASLLLTHDSPKVCVSEEEDAVDVVLVELWPLPGMIQVPRSLMRDILLIRRKLADALRGAEPAGYVCQDEVVANIVRSLCQKSQTPLLCPELVPYCGMQSIPLDQYEDRLYQRTCEVRKSKVAPCQTSTPEEYEYMHYQPRFEDSRDDATPLQTSKQENDLAVCIVFVPVLLCLFFFSLSIVAPYLWGVPQRYL